MEAASKKDLESLAKKFDDFFIQYDLDMRGDMDADDGGKRGLVDNMREIRRIQRVYPSLTWLLYHRPIPTIAVGVGVFLILYGSLALGVMQLLASLLGIDASQVPAVVH